LINRYNKRILYPAFWIFLLLIQIFLISNFKSLHEAIFRSLSNTLLILLVFYFNKYLVYHFYDEKNFKKYLLYQLILIVSISVLRRSIELTFFNRFVLIEQPAESYVIPLHAIAILFNFFAAITISVFSSLYFVGERKKALELQHNKLQFEHLENKMEMLNNQLSSHFLFNSLNNIYASAVLQNGETPEMILKLSDIMRFITYDANLNQILFHTEIEQAKNYIKFFELKSDNELNINFKEDHNNYSLMVMPMLLIPLIENALKHGNLNDTEKKSFLNIDVSYNERNLKIIVGNSYQSTPTNEWPKGIGLTNYKRRLELRYPNQHVLNLNRSETFFETTLILTLPQ